MECSFGNACNITKLLNSGGPNRLAVIVCPIDPVGNPNGGQGGDGTIARNVSHQYVAGWDWIQPMRDRNTGIWDKVYIERTGGVNIKNPHVVTMVPGVRKVDGPQAPAQIMASAELENPTATKKEGVLQYQIDGQVVKQTVSIEAGSVKEVTLPVYQLSNPKLWWPNGYGPQNLYTLRFQFLEGGQTVTDEETVTTGVREIQADWNATTRSKQISVNGQKDLYQRWQLDHLRCYASLHRSALRCRGALSSRYEPEPHPHMGWGAHASGPSSSTPAINMGCL